MDGKERVNIKPGIRVLIIQKQDQRTGKTTEGVVETILTRPAVHPHGIKVRLVGGLVGRVKQIIPEGER
ncbi:MAG TPA: YwbE family protein [Desulfotomaculum sp.]|nr:YwbE family protein [Desulfotomaculum sp.]HBY04359.1 YwbE family protein [Desulfotomaculum sp.]